MCPAHDQAELKRVRQRWPHSLRTHLATHRRVAIPFTVLITEFVFRDVDQGKTQITMLLIRDRLIGRSERA